MTNPVTPRLRPATPPITLVRQAFPLAPTEEPSPALFSEFNESGDEPFDVFFQDFWYSCDVQEGEVMVMIAESSEEASSLLDYLHLNCTHPHLDLTEPLCEDDEWRVFSVALSLARYGDHEKTLLALFASMTDEQKELLLTCRDEGLQMSLLQRTILGGYTRLALQMINFLSTANDQKFRPTIAKRLVTALHTKNMELVSVILPYCLPQDFFQVCEAGETAFTQACALGAMRLAGQMLDTLGDNQCKIFFYLMQDGRSVLQPSRLHALQSTFFRLPDLGLVEGNAELLEECLVSHSSGVTPLSMALKCVDARHPHAVAILESFVDWSSDEVINQCDVQTGKAPFWASVAFGNADLCLKLLNRSSDTILLASTYPEISAIGSWPESWANGLAQTLNERRRGSQVPSFTLGPPLLPPPLPVKDDPAQRRPGSA